MKNKEYIENQAYMILNDLAFCFKQTENDCAVVVFNLKNIKQTAIFRVRNIDLLLCESNMSKENTYKAMLIAERNKKMIIEGMNTWASI